jgi:signal transduction histidine kinase
VGAELHPYWKDFSQRFYNDVEPGRYVLQVQAFDWAGRPYGPMVFNFRVTPPWWRSWPALSAYALLLVGLFAAAFQWRVGVIRRGAALVVESERRAEAEKAFFEQQIREAQKLESLGTLAGGVAHDFNNLLGVIRGNAELARTATRKGRNADDNLGAILDASDRARDVVRQILTFSRRSSPTREYVDLSRLVVDLEPLLRRMVPRHVQVVIHGADTPHVLMGDPTQLQQLLLNLVSNAEYAMRGRADGVLTMMPEQHIWFCDWYDKMPQHE